MSQSELALEPDPEPGQDVFDMNVLVDEAPEASRTQSEPANTKGTPTTRKSQSFSSRIGAIHFGVASALIAAVWILWPSWGDRGPAERAFAVAPPTAGAERASARVAVKPSRLQSASGASEQAMPTPEQAASSGEGNTTASATAPLDMRIVAEQAKQATALITAIDEMNRRILDLEARMANTAVPVSAGTNSAVQPRTSRSAGDRPWRSTDRSAKEPALAPGNYRLHTIFRDQAWIHDGDQVRVITAGDILNDMTVIRIDPDNRRVLTTRGMIR